MDVRIKCENKTRSTIILVLNTPNGLLVFLISKLQIRREIFHLDMTSLRPLNYVCVRDIFGNLITQRIRHWFSRKFAIFAKLIWKIQVTLYGGEKTWYTLKVSHSTIAWNWHKPFTSCQHWFFVNTNMFCLKREITDVVK